MPYFRSLLVVQTILHREFKQVGVGAWEIGYVPIILSMPLAQAP
jgi:hypothetical protein